jgi:hypothetical protein
LDYFAAGLRPRIQRDMFSRDARYLHKILTFPPFPVAECLPCPPNVDPERSPALTTSTHLALRPAGIVSYLPPGKEPRLQESPTELFPTLWFTFSDSADPRSGNARSVHVHREGLCDLFGGYDACYDERSTWGFWRM